MLTWSPGILAMEKNKGMPPGQLSIQARGFRSKILHWWRNSRKTYSFGVGILLLLGEGVIMAEL